MVCPASAATTTPSAARCTIYAGSAEGIVLAAWAAMGFRTAIPWRMSAGHRISEKTTTSQRMLPPQTPQESSSTPLFGTPSHPVCNVSELCLVHTHVGYLVLNSAQQARRILNTGQCKASASDLQHGTVQSERVDAVPAHRDVSPFRQIRRSDRPRDGSGRCPLRLPRKHAHVRCGGQGGQSPVRQPHADSLLRRTGAYRRSHGRDYAACTE